MMMRPTFLIPVLFPVLILFTMSFATITATTTTKSSVPASPVTNWDTAWTASSLKGTVVVIPCHEESENVTNTKNNNALLVVLLQQPSTASVPSLPSFTVLDQAFVAWTGFAVDVECVMNQLLQHTDDSISIYNHGLNHVAPFLASCIRKEAMDRSGRPLAVQALVVQRQKVWTIDPSGACTLWNSGATAMGKDAVFVRKQLHAALQKFTTEMPSITQALRIALEVMPKSYAATTDNTNSQQTKDLPRAFLLRDNRPTTTDGTISSPLPSTSALRLDPKMIIEQLQLLSSKSSSDHIATNE